MGLRWYLNLEDFTEIVQYYLMEIVDLGRGRPQFKLLFNHEAFWLTFSLLLWDEKDTELCLLEKGFFNTTHIMNKNGMLNWQDKLESLQMASNKLEPSQLCMIYPWTDYCLLLMCFPENLQVDTVWACLILGSWFDLSCIGSCSCSLFALVLNCCFM